MSKSKELATADFNNPILSDQDGLQDVLEVLSENLGDTMQMGLTDLDKVSVPNGTKSFMIPTLDGEISENELTGVVLLARTNRAFWPTNELGDEPPQCYSDDGVTGHGDPGGACGSCALAQFGSAQQYIEGAKGQGQACKQTIILFVLTEDGFLPKVLRLPPTSLGSWRQYLISLTGRRLKMGDVLTRFEVEIEKNAAGQPYSKIVPKFGGRLGEDGKNQLASLAEVLVPRLRLARLDPPEELDPAAA